MEGKLLIIDQGNTRCKYWLIEDDVWSEVHYFENINSSFTQLPEATSAILSSTKIVELGTLTHLKKAYNSFIMLSGETVVPFKVNYDSIKTLGPDRLANVAGLWSKDLRFPQLAIDVGTCITYDFLHPERGYFGGAISPGFRLRNQSMNDYTDKIPLVDFYPNPELIGVDTTTSVQSGIVNGLIHEILGTIERYRERFPSIMTTITGGDTHYFDNHLKSYIFADPKLTAKGLLKILRFHAE